MPDPNVGTAKEPDLVLPGRAADLAALVGAFEEAERGRGGLALVTGEAGIGKSALCDAFARRASAAGATVVLGRAWELGGAPPYFPVLPCLRALGVPAPASNVSDLWDSTLLGLAGAVGAPIVWLVEDLHAADLQTWDLLAFLSRPLRAVRALIVATARRDDPRLSEQALLRLAHVCRDGVEIALAPLSREEVGAVASRCAGRDVPPRTVARLADLTGGNPLFITECARAMRDSDGTDDDALVLPANVRLAIHERVSRLPESCRDILATAAVLGRELTAARVAAILSISPARAADGLAPAVRAGLLVETAGGFRFRHDLVRVALEDALSSEQRVLLHQKAAEALDEGSDSLEILAERARHALEGATRETAARALAVALAAADGFAAQGAHDRAYEMRLRVERVRRADLLPPASADELLHLARLAAEAGRHADARALCDRVADGARARRDAVLLGRAAWMRGAGLQPGVVDPGLVSVLTEALQGLPDEPTDLRCRLLARLAAARQPARDEIAVVETARQALAMARTLGGEALLRDVLLYAGAAMVDVAPLEERLTSSTELLGLALASGDLEKALRALCRLAVDSIEQNAFGTFDETVTSLLDVSFASGAPRHRWRPLLFASMRAQMFGLFDGAERFVVEARELSGLIDDPALGLSLAAHALRRARLLHDEAGMSAALREYALAMAGVPSGELVLQAFRIGGFARIRDTAAVCAELEHLGDRDRALWERGFRAWLAEAYALGGNREQVERAYAFFAGAADLPVVVSHVAIAYEGLTLRLLALLDARRGDLRAAQDGIARALDLERSRGHRPWIAQLSYELAVVSSAAGQRGAAAEHFRAAADLAEDMGMAGLARRALAGLGEGGRGLRPDDDGPRRAELRQEGDLWRVSVGRESVVVRDSRGMQLLARLVNRAGQEVHVLALASDHQDVLRESHAGETIDEAARRAYRSRLAEIEDHLAGCDDVARERLSTEKDALERELARAFGLGGRPRRAGSTSERARVNAQRRLKEAVERIAQAAPALGRHFARSLKTGTYCCYRP